ncbi:MAG: hypothetical protein H7099_04155 [Gemmatimonadaceae bacterium]|nr:hypothetical protein [Gemmatimonadaceae bacterium]
MRLTLAQRFCISSALALLAGCGGGDGGTAPPPAATTGSLSVGVAGLPSDVAGSVIVTGPSGYTSTVTSAQTLSGLVPGSYTVTPARVSDKNIGYAATGATVTVTAGATATASAAYGLRLLSRTTTNRTDVTTSARFHLFYALPSDGVDRGLDTNGVIHRTISSGQRWLAGQTGNRSIRFDVSDDALDITFIRLPRTDAAYYGYNGAILDSIAKDLRTAGWNQANLLLLAYYDGRHIDRCGSAAVPPTIYPGNTGAIYLKGAPTSPVPCATTPFAAAPTTAPAYQEFLALHEMFHLLGLVSTPAPNHALAGHVGNDPTDLMYAGTQVWRPSTVDVTKTNYYNAAGLPAGVTNFTTSPYVVAP